MKTNKILCIRKDWYEELVELIKTRFVREKKKQLKNSKKKAETKVLGNKKKANYRIYETSTIWYTRDSEYWSWLRAKEWFNKYIKEKDERKNEKELRILGVI